MYGYLYIPAIRTSLSKRMNATGLRQATYRNVRRCRSGPDGNTYGGITSNSRKVSNCP